MLNRNQGKLTQENLQENMKVYWKESLELALQDVYWRTSTATYCSLSLSSLNYVDMMDWYKDEMEHVW